MSNSTQPEKLHTASVIPHAARTNARVYVIDDESEVRRSLHLLLSTADIVSWPFASASDFLDNLEDLEPAPILLDIRMPDIDGIQLMTLIRERGIEWPVIILTAHGEVRTAVQAMRLGAIEFLEKPFEFEMLEACLEIAFAKLDAVTGTDAVRQLARRRFSLLSPRETEVINVLMQGIPNKNAAHLLSLSVRTIEMHRANALAKLNVKSLAEVVWLAGDAGLDTGGIATDVDDVCN